MMVVLEVQQEIPRQEEAEGPRDVLGRLHGRGHHVRHVRREELNLRVRKEDNKSTKGAWCLVLKRLLYVEVQLKGASKT